MVDTKFCTDNIISQKIHFYSNGKPMIMCPTIRHFDSNKKKIFKFLYLYHKQSFEHLKAPIII